MRNVIKSIEDKDSDRANHRRGYHDSIKIVTFVDDATVEEMNAGLEEIMQSLRPRNMWVHLVTKADDPNTPPRTWTIRYGYDSGD